MPDTNPDATTKQTLKPAQPIDPSTLQHKLVRHLKRAHAIRTAPVEAAFLAVPRHLFVPNVALEQVYADRVILLKEEDGHWVSSSSQPSMMAIMLEQLALQAGQRVLEIGAGSGYNAALMAQIVGETGHVVTVDIDEEMVAAARQHLDAAGFGRVQTVCADGGHGYAEGAPYDCIILTVGASDITPAWLQQLKPNGRLLLPLEVVGAQQCSVLFERVQNNTGDQTEDHIGDQTGDHLVSRSIRGAIFIRLRGEFTAQAPTSQQLGPDPGLFLQGSTEAALPVELDTIYAWLTGPYLDFATGVSLVTEEIFYKLAWWMALQGSGHEALVGAVGCGVVAQDEMVERNLVPVLSEMDGDTKSIFTSGLVNKIGMACLIRPPGQPVPPFDWESSKHREPPYELYVRQYGMISDGMLSDGLIPDGMIPASEQPSGDALKETPRIDTQLAQFIVNQIQQWDQAGRPSIESIRIRCYPINAEYTPRPGEFVVKKKCSQLVIEL